MSQETVGIERWEWANTEIAFCEYPRGVAKGDHLELFLNVKTSEEPAVVIEGLDGWTLASFAATERGMVYLSVTRTWDGSRPDTLGLRFSQRTWGSAVMTATRKP